MFGQMFGNFVIARVPLVREDVHCGCSDSRVGQGKERGVEMPVIGET
jgi:hypothetical protein